MIVTIYGNTNCGKCKSVKEKYPEATYYDINKLEYEEKVKLRNKIKEQVKTSNISYPILFDDKGRIIL